MLSSFVSSSSSSLAPSLSSLPPTMLQKTLPLSPPLSSLEKLLNFTTPLTADPSLPTPTTVTIPAPTRVHIAMTLDTAYIRGSMAAILSVLQHFSCPQNVFFHFVCSSNPSLLCSTVSGIISTSIRSALDCPLNYARSYLANLLPLCVRRVVFLDSDLLLE